MDIEDWEILPDDGFLEIHDDGSGNKIFSRKYVSHPSKHVFQMNNYFNISPKSSCRFRFDSPPNQGNENPRVVAPNQLVPVPIELDFVVPSPPPAVITTDKATIESPSSNQDGVSQVFFKKENEFVDMKLDSPRSNAGTKGTVPPFDAAAGSFPYDDDETGIEKDLGLRKEDDGGFNFWRWSLTGVGAICSFGVAAATICVIVFTNHHKNKNQHNQKLRFQMYTDDKRIKQVVQHATKLNEAISVARGVPLTRAQFTVGGYYDGL